MSAYILLFSISQELVCAPCCSRVHIVPCICGGGANNLPFGAGDDLQRTRWDSRAKSGGKRTFAPECTCIAVKKKRAVCAVPNTPAPTHKKHGTHHGLYLTGGRFGSRLSSRG
eukprot:1188329-Prorocentrum_minimum.AAC.1